ncbi:MAG: PilZ domain-containing protein [Candidatus Schekmanbacteria bacterium]|nr:PilZ domain-containing protein [Candidatus Schekmanbacteria bacterium]
MWRKVEDMRKFIRHPSDVPIDVSAESETGTRRERLQNISLGGLCYMSANAVAPGTCVKVRFPIVSPRFQARGKIAWCREREGTCHIGVAFVEEQDLFRVRLLEQLCHIMHYKAEMSITEGRELSTEEAAREWIDRYASSFPAFDEAEQVG